MKHYLQSKTFWAATVSVVLEVLNGFQTLPYLTDYQAHAVAVFLMIFVAVNRALK